MIHLRLCNAKSNFYPRSPCGERPCIMTITTCIVSFLSTLSLRRATRYGRPIDVQLVFLSTLSLRRATAQVCKVISPELYFYPRSPCGERPPWPARLASRLDFYPRSPCGERRPEYFLTWHCIRISIHALLAESDYILVNTFLEIFEFLSTLSLRRATRLAPFRTKAVRNFYPRSPCGERRSRRIYHLLPTSNFYPRSPCGERQHAYQLVLWVLRFLSTLSLRRATRQRKNKDGTQQFLSTLSLRRATQ